MNAPLKTPALYEISGKYMEALDTLTDPEVDMPLEAVVDTMESIEGELREKAVCVVQYMRNLESTAAAIKEAERKMADRRKALENRAASLKQYVHDSMQYTGVSKIESPWFALAIQKSPPAVTLTGEAVEASMRNVTVVMTAEQWQKIQDQAQEFTVKCDAPDKTRIKEALKSGADVTGAELTQGTRLAIRGG